MVMVMMMVVVPMMRRVRQRDVCEKYQRNDKSDNLAHDSRPLWNGCASEIPPGARHQDSF
jgi:hypothetical protein